MVRYTGVYYPDIELREIVHQQILKLSIRQMGKLELVS